VARWSGRFFTKRALELEQVAEDVAGGAGAGEQSKEWVGKWEGKRKYYCAALVQIALWTKEAQRDYLAGDWLTRGWSGAEGKAKAREGERTRRPRFGKAEPGVPREVAGAKKCCFPFQFWIRSETEMKERL
jgi:hypothetical protein